MTKELTMLWEKGKLENGYYYISHKNGKNYVCLILQGDYELQKDDIIDVKEKVPNFNTWDATRTKLANMEKLCETYKREVSNLMKKRG